MTTSTSRTLEDVIRDSGEMWMLDQFPSREQGLNHIRTTIEAVRQAAHARGLSAQKMPSEEGLVREYGRNPAHVRAFFQALSGTCTPQMLLMVWRILQGVSIKAVNLSYGYQGSFSASIVLQAIDGTNDPPYESTDIFDFALFRHLGILKIDGKPVLEGFYALQLGNRR